MGEKWVQVKLGVEIFEAKPNKMFTQAQTELTRFLRYTAAVPCAECGRRRKTHWTQLCSFKALTMRNAFGVLDAQMANAQVHPPLAPVCRDHLLAPEVEEVDPPAEAEQQQEPKV